MVEDNAGVRFERIEYRHMAYGGIGKDLEVYASGKVLYTIHAPSGRESVPEIGDYETTLTRAEVAQIKAALKQVDFEDLHTHGANGEYRNIEVHQNAWSYERGVGAEEADDGRFGYLAGIFEQITAKAMEHPRQALRLRVLDFDVRGDRHATMIVELSSVGDLPFAGPLFFSGSLVVRLDPMLQFTPDAVEEINGPDIKPRTTFAIPERGARTYRVTVDLSRATARATEATVEFDTGTQRLTVKVPILIPLFRVAAPPPGPHP